MTLSNTVGHLWSNTTTARVGDREYGRAPERLHLSTNTCILLLTEFVDQDSAKIPYITPNHLMQTYQPRSTSFQTSYRIPNLRPKPSNESATSSSESKRKLTNKWKKLSLTTCMPLHSKISLLAEQSWARKRTLQAYKGMTLSDTSSKTTQPIAWSLLAQVVFLMHSSLS